MMRDQLTWGCMASSFEKAISGVKVSAQHEVPIGDLNVDHLTNCVRGAVGDILTGLNRVRPPLLAFIGFGLFLIWMQGLCCTPQDYGSLGYFQEIVHKKKTSFFKFVFFGIMGTFAAFMSVAVFIALFGLIAVLGFVAKNFKKVLAEIQKNRHLAEEFWHKQFPTIKSLLFELFGRYDKEVGISYFVETMLLKVYQPFLLFFINFLKLRKLNEDLYPPLTGAPTVYLKLQCFDWSANAEDMLERVENAFVAFKLAGNRAHLDGVVEQSDQAFLEKIYAQFGAEAELGIVDSLRQSTKGSYRALRTCCSAEQDIREQHEVPDTSLVGTT